MTDIRYATGWHDALRGRQMVARHSKEYARGYRAAQRELKAAKSAAKLNKLLEARRQQGRHQKPT